MEKEKIDDELTYKIIGCAMRVHAYLGNGFQEVIYQRALAIEMKKAGILFAREIDMDIHFYDEVIGTRRVDFFVENMVPVELKAITKLENSNISQGLNYLRVYKIEKGLLINFGAPSLEVKRLRPPLKYKKDAPQ